MSPLLNCGSNTSSNTANNTVASCSFVSLFNVTSKSDVNTSRAEMNKNVVDSNVMSPMFTSYKLWHYRLGQPHHDALKEALKLCNVAVPNKTSLDFCSACCLGKACHLPAPSSTTVDHCPFELVVCDLWGPAPLQSSCGCSYFLTCVDAMPTCISLGFFL